MKTVLLGKIIENNYSVDPKQKKITDNYGKIKNVYTDKPVINKTTEIINWEEVCSFEGEPRYNCETRGYYNEMNISADESVVITKEIFRADLNELHLFTDKVVEVFDKNKDAADDLLALHIKDFNRMMIESNEAMRDYCDLHGLSYETSDCIKVFKMVFPGKEYHIVDGVMKENKYLSTVEISGIIDNAKCYTDVIDLAATSIDGRISALSTSVDCYSETITATKADAIASTLTSTTVEDIW